MNDRPTPKEQILNPIYDGPVEVDGFGKAHPVGHTGELRRTKEENRELRVRVAELEVENARLRDGIARIEQTPLGGYHVQIAHSLLNP